MTLNYKKVPSQKGISPTIPNHVWRIASIGASLAAWLAG